MAFTGGNEQLRIDEGTKAMAAQLKVVGLSGDSVNTDRQKALEAALAQIDRAFGKGSAMKLGSREKIEIDTVSTGSLGLDIALGVGGLPRGRVIEIYGRKARARRRLRCTPLPRRRRSAAPLLSWTPSMRSIRAMPRSSASTSTS